MRFPAFAAAAALAVPASLDAKPDAAELNCILARADRTDIQAAWSAQHEQRPPSAVESAALDRLTGVADDCITRYHWSRERAAMALTYAFARVTYDDALRELVARGISPDIVDQVAADIGERGRRALSEGDTSDGNFELVAAAVARALARTHAPVRSGSPELAEAGRLIARGLHAMLIRDQAVAAFAEQ